MGSLGSGVSTFRVFPYSNLQFSLEQRHIKTFPIGFLKHWAGLGVLSLHRWTRTGTPSGLFSSQLNQSKKMKSLQQAYRRNLWRAELAQDAPFVIAIGACIFSSFAFVQENNDENKRSESSPENSDLVANDMRDGAMTIISFIPLFNWLGWVFAWLDTNEKRYLFYAIVYLAPYLRTGFSLSPDDSWLPIASIIACIVHVQLEINLKTGAELGNEFLRDALRQIDPKVRLPKLWDQGKRSTEQFPPEPSEQQFITEEELHRRELLEFDKSLSRVEDLSEKKKLGKSDQIETRKKAYKPEESDD